MTVLLLRYLAGCFLIVLETSIAVVRIAEVLGEEALRLPDVAVARQSTLL